MRKFLLSLGLLAIALVISHPSPSFAQSFPTKQMRFVVPYPPGGSGDFLGRLYSEHLGRVLGSTVIVENKPGALAMITRKLANAGVNLEAAMPTGMSGNKVQIAFATDNAAKATEALGESMLVGTMSS